MRISDWSSDVCSSDLVSHTKARLPATMRYQAKGPKPLRLTMPTNHLITSNATMKEITKPTPISLQRTIKSEEHTSELQSLMRISYAVFCLKKKNKKTENNNQQINRRHNTEQ